MDRIHKQFQVFLQPCNISPMEDMETGSLEEFRELQKLVERGEWITTTPLPPCLGRDSGAKKQWAKEIRERRRRGKKRIRRRKLGTEKIEVGEEEPWCGTKS